MELQRWAEIESIYRGALAKAPDERFSYLREVCCGDERLRGEVESLLGYADARLSNPIFEERGETSTPFGLLGVIMRRSNIAFIEPPRPFQTGQIVRERFEILREIGQGGMGVVYEAFDRKRNRRIAIKAAKPGFQRFLSPELEGALTVRHPNVCRVNEIYTETTDLGEVDFLTMELLEGETLMAYLKTRSKLPESEALEIARQICAGISEAHRCGTIHRDLKSANIILCSSPKQPVRAVITDFGLAGEARDTDDLGGTPAYMAPELWGREKTSKASDLYALGVVLYEMVVDPKLLGLGDGKPWQPALNGLSRPWAKAIARCVDASPDKRPSDAIEALATLERRPSKWRFLLTLPLAFVLALSFPQLRNPVHDRIWPPPNVRLVVLPATGPESSKEFAEGLLQDVSNRIAHLTSGARLVEVIPPMDAGAIHVQTPPQAREAHATHALQTFLSRDGNDVLVKASLIDLKTENQIKQFSSRYAPATVGAIPSAIAGSVSDGLSLQGNVRAELISPAATVPYDKGLQLLQQDVKNYGRAIQLFRAAAVLDPRSPLLLSNLVEAEVSEFDRTRDSTLLSRARDDLRAAESLNPDSVNVHLAAGKLSETAGEYEKARDEYLRAKQIEPSNLTGLIRLGRMYDKLGMQEKAIQSYREAIEIDPAFYMPHEHLGKFYYSRGRFAEASEEFKKVTERAPREILAYTNLSASLEEIGKYAEAEQALSTALKIGVTPAGLNNMGTALASERRDAEALSYYERAIDLNPSNYLYWLNLADSNRRLGHAVSAKGQYKKGMDVALAQLRQNPRAAYVRAAVAYFLARLGQKERAESENDQALQLARDNNEVIDLAVITYEALGLRDLAVAALNGATLELLRELEREPDLVGLSQDPRFKEALMKVDKGESKHAE